VSRLADNFAAVRARIADACRAAGRPERDVQLLAVSKRHPPQAVLDAIEEGQSMFGENRVQELVQKAGELADAPLEWHLIGSLQTNKVRDLLRVARLTLLHSLDRVRLANALHAELEANGRQLDVLLQVNASQEEQKHGCALEDAPALLEHVQQRCATIRVQGLMAMGPLEGDARVAFDRAAALRDDLRVRSGLPLDTLSLGMSGDLEQAIAAGSTMVRVGTALFGARD